MHTYRFFSSKITTIRTAGVDALVMLVKQYPACAITHQLVVVDCLSDADETLKRQTLELLFHMINSVNAKSVIPKILEYVSESYDYNYNKELVVKLIYLCDR